MKFSEAMEKLKSGSKVTRKPWQEGVYFMLDGKDVKSFQPKLSPYIYNEDIMISEGWVIDGAREELKFCDVVPHLLQGAKVKMKHWKDSFIYFDNMQKSLIINSMDIFPFTPSFDSFVAEDWMELA